MEMPICPPVSERLTSVVPLFRNGRVDHDILRVGIPARLCDFGILVRIIAGRDRHADQVPAHIRLEGGLVARLVAQIHHAQAALVLRGIQPVQPGEEGPVFLCRLLVDGVAVLVDDGILQGHRHPRHRGEIVVLIAADHKQGDLVLLSVLIGIPVAEGGEDGLIFLHRFRDIQAQIVQPVLPDEDAHIVFVLHEEIVQRIDAAVCRRHLPAQLGIFVEDALDVRRILVDQLVQRNDHLFARIFVDIRHAPVGKPHDVRQFPAAVDARFHRNVPLLGREDLPVEFDVHARLRFPVDGKIFGEARRGVPVIRAGIGDRFPVPEGKFVAFGHLGHIGDILDAPLRKFIAAAAAQRQNERGRQGNQRHPQTKTLHISSLLLIERRPAAVSACFINTPFPPQMQARKFLLAVQYFTRPAHPTSKPCI